MGDQYRAGSVGRPLPSRERDPDEIERIARVGSWTLDPTTGAATWSNQMYRILGVDTEGPAVALPDISILFTAESVSRVTAAIARTIRTGLPWHEELELARPGGGWVISNGIAEVDAAGVVVGIHGTMQDVTDQRRLEAQLRQAQRLESIGRLAGGIAHDFNNLLTAIRGYASLARASLDDAHPVAADLDQVMCGADRAAELVRQLLAFSRHQVLEPRVIDPTDVVDELVPMIRRLLGEDIEMRAVHQADVGRITVDPSQLGQVILNLAVNARDAMPLGGTLTVETMNVELDAKYAALHPEVAPGPHVLIAVADTGHGMDPETRAQAFEPFFTTKAPDKGTGMGLATVYGIVRQSGGSIYLYSEPGWGTTFKLYFPRTDLPPTVDAVADDEAAKPTTGTETILLVEDNDDVRGFAARVLASAGYTVLDTADGAQAMALAAGYRGRIDLLLTDVVMPGMHGAELAERLAADRPEMRVIYASGFTENTVIQDGVVAPGVRLLTKPYRGADALRLVRVVLDG